jgi:demethylmenaquinone methyltransferase/2-methoxy-6-polyprenyl-1,4-benzoquinol methylase
MGVETVKPYDSKESKREQIARAFDVLAHRYDRLNRVLSLGLDLGWRRHALRLLRDAPPARLLDVATGTGDLALLAARLFPQTAVTGVDLSEGMLAIGREKVVAAGLASRVTLQAGDALALGFPDAIFDAATAAFGVRNFENLVSGFSEIRRVLQPGGRFVVLELSEPQAFPLRQLHRFYLRHWIPFVGRLLTGHTKEYAYLPASIEQVPQGEAMLALLREAGFTDCRCARYTFGICSCYSATRPQSSAVI